MEWSVLLLLIVCLQPDCSRGQSQGCNLTSLPAELSLKEGSPNGTVLLEQSGLEKMELTRFKSPNPPPFIGLQEGALYLNDTFQLDDRQELCNAFIGQGLQWTVFLRCPDQSETHAISINVNLTDDYPPEFTTNFTEEMQEMTLVGSEVMTVRSNQVTDRDCAGNAQAGSSIFTIEAGNRNEAFAFPNPRNGRIVVRRMLDYENGDTHFLLNMSISNINLPDRKSYTTLEVTVIDIDDSDPVFDHQGYVLHVQEEDTSSVGVWASTDPPISVSDPDKDVAEQDPLTIALRNVSDASTLEVNSSTGQVKLMRTLDREQHPSLLLVLKVQQTISWWRSSTVTLTVLVDDVNDHRPLFTRAVYDVSVAEHSPPGTSVALVLATDADVGDNANFTYILPDGEHAFSLVERRLGQDLYGLLLVRNSSLLDRETTPQINLTIGTEEEGAGVPSGGCQEGACQGRVLITLWDINDHSPVFDQPRYVLRVSNTTDPSPALVSVKATDADVGPNADVTYAMSEFGPDVCDYVTIDARSGDVNLTDSVARTEECSMIVTACDNPMELSQRRCSTVPVQILSGDKDEVNGEVVMFEVPVPPASLLYETAFLERELGVVLGASVSIRRIRPSSESNRSWVSISATNVTSREALSSQKLQTLVDGKREAIAAIFQHYRVVVTPPSEAEDDDVFSPLFIALIVIVVALLAAVWVALVFVVKSRRRYTKQKRLLEKFSSTLSPIYDTADTSKPQNGTAPTPTTTTTTNNNDNHSSMTTSPSDVVAASLRSSDSRRVDGNGGQAQTAILAELGRAGGFHRNGDVHGNGDTRVGEVIDRGTVRYDDVITRVAVGEASAPSVDGGDPRKEDADVQKKATVPGIDPPDSPRDRRLEESDTLSSHEEGPIARTHGTSTTNTASNNNNNNNHKEPVTVDNASRPSSNEAVRDGIDAAPDPDLNISGVAQPHAEGVSKNTGYDNNNGDPHSQHSDRHADYSPSEEDARLTASSKLADWQEPASLPTPAPSTAAEEDEDRVVGVPEEPEPDYAKKVRFSASVVQLESSSGGGENGDDVKESTLGNGNGAGGSTASADMDWNMYEEMTAF